MANRRPWTARLHLYDHHEEIETIEYKSRLKQRSLVKGSELADRPFLFPNEQAIGPFEVFIHIDQVL